jgi:hypothetical protein
MTNEEEEDFDSDDSADGPTNNSPIQRESLAPSKEATRELVRLRAATTAITDHNHILSIRLKDASSVNKYLGGELYKIDQELNDLEAQVEIESKRFREIRIQTVAMRKKCADYRQLFARDRETADLAKQLEQTRRLKLVLEAKFTSLKLLVEDPLFESLPDVSETCREQMHFLFWNTAELRRRLTALQQFDGGPDDDSDREQFREMDRRWNAEFQSLSPEPGSEEEQFRPQTPPPPAPKSAAASPIVPIAAADTVERPARFVKNGFCKIPFIQSRAALRVPRPVRAPLQTVDHDYEYYDENEERPANPKRGTVRISAHDPQFEYQYYDDSDRTDDDVFDIREESDPPCVIVAKRSRRPVSLPRVIARHPKPPEPDPVVVGHIPPLNNSEEVVQIKDLAPNLSKRLPAIRPAVVIVKRSSATADDSSDIWASDSSGSENATTAGRSTAKLPATRKAAKRADRPKSQSRPKRTERLSNADRLSSAERAQSTEQFVIVRNAPPPPPAPPRPGFQSLPTSAPKTVATYAPGAFKKVRETGPGPRRRTITADGKEYEYEYDYSYGDVDLVDSVAPTAASAGSALRLVVREFPTLHIADFAPSENVSNAALAAQVRELDAARAAAEAQLNATQRELSGLEAALDGRNCAVERESLTIGPAESAIEKVGTATATIQTVITAGAIDSRVSRAAAQQRDADAVRSLDSRRDAVAGEVEEAEGNARDVARAIEGQIARAAQLRADLVSVRDELSRADAGAAAEEQKSAAIEADLASLSNVAAQEEQRFEKASVHVATLQHQLDEMVRFRAVLEAELSDVHNREKPEVRQLAENVRATKQLIEEHAVRTQTLQRRIAARRREIETPADDAIALRLEIADLARRKRRWENVEQIGQAQPPSERIVQKRHELVMEVLAKERRLMVIQDEVAAMAEHERLLEAAVAEPS